MCRWRPSSPNARYAGFEIDAQRWSRTAAFIARCLAQPAFADLAPLEMALIRNPPGQTRQEALLNAGAPLSDKSYAADRPRKGVMEI